jgi:hypothetical protein
MWKAAIMTYLGTQLVELMKTLGQDNWHFSQYSN